MSLGDNENSWRNEEGMSRNRTKKPKGRPRADS